jgi:hypothetical protein
LLPAPALAPLLGSSDGSSVSRQCSVASSMSARAGSPQDVEARDAPLQLLEGAARRSSLRSGGERREARQAAQAAPTVSSKVDVVRAASGRSRSCSSST